MEDFSVSAPIFSGERNWHTESPIIKPRNLHYTQERYDITPKDGISVKMQMPPEYSKELVSKKESKSDTLTDVLYYTSEVVKAASVLLPAVKVLGRFGSAFRAGGQIASSEASVALRTAEREIAPTLKTSAEELIERETDRLSHLPAVRSRVQINGNSINRIREAVGEEFRQINWKARDLPTDWSLDDYRYYKHEAIHDKFGAIDAPAELARLDDLYANKLDLHLDRFTKENPGVRITPKDLDNFTKHEFPEYARFERMVGYDHDSSTVNTFQGVLFKRDSLIQKQIQQDTIRTTTRELQRRFNVPTYPPLPKLTPNESLASLPSPGVISDPLFPNKSAQRLTADITDAKIRQHLTPDAKSLWDPVRNAESNFKDSIAQIQPNSLLATSRIASSVRGPGLLAHSRIASLERGPIIDWDDSEDPSEEVDRGVFYSLLNTAENLGESVVAATTGAYAGGLVGGALGSAIGGPPGTIIGYAAGAAMGELVASGLQTYKDKLFGLNPDWLGNLIENNRKTVSKTSWNEPIPQTPKKPSVLLPEKPSVLLPVVNLSSGFNNLQQNKTDPSLLTESKSPSFLKYTTPRPRKNNKPPHNVIPSTKKRKHNKI